jgi:hypothetical protein
MTTKRRSLTPVRRAILVSALAIVAPALVLFFLGLQTLQRQQQTMADLQVTTLALSARQLAAEIELRAGELAETCLRDERLARAALAAGTQLTLETVLDLRALTAEIGADGPLAADFFVLHGDTVRFPLVHDLLHRRLDEYPTQEAVEVREAFAELFARAETLELERQRPDRALDAYRDSQKL